MHTHIHATCKKDGYWGFVRQGWPVPRPLWDHLYPHPLPAFLHLGCSHGSGPVCCVPTAPSLPCLWDAGHECTLMCTVAAEGTWGVEAQICRGVAAYGEAAGGFVSSAKTPWVIPALRCLSQRKNTSLHHFLCCIGC